MGKHDAPRTASEPVAARFARRLVNGVRVAVLAGAALGLIGMIGHLVGLPLITSTLGPTAYLFIAHPEHETARLRNASVAQAAAIASGVLALLATGLILSPDGDPLLQAVASALGVALTMLFLELVRSHHAPAASTVLLLTTGLAWSPKPFAGLVLGIAALLPLVMALSRVPLFRRRRTAPAAEEAFTSDPASRHRQLERTAGESTARRRLRRLERASRGAALGGILIGVIGVGGWLSELPLLSSALGPTAYLFFAHPEQEAARTRNAIVAHSAAIAAGVVALAVTGVISQLSGAAPAMALAPGLALALTLLTVELTGTHHAPAGSTAVLVASGVSGPGLPLTGLALGLAALLVLAALHNAVTYRLRAS
jgi:hypothetical protein